MSYIDNLELSEEVVQRNIKPNGTKSITAQILQDVLMNMLDATEADLTNAASGLQENIDSFVATSDNIGDEAVITSKIDYSAVTTPKLNDAAVTTPKIKDLAVTYQKLSGDVTTFLLTEDMKEWVIEKMDADRQAEAQTLFVGDTINSGTTSFVYGEYSKEQMKKDAFVTLKFNGEQVIANSTPEGWVLEGYTYRCALSVNGKSNVPTTVFAYTVPEGKYRGCTVTYGSKSAGVTFITPVWYGFVPTNDETNLTSQVIGALNYSNRNVNLASATLANGLSTPAYFCAITRGSASATQMGISIFSDGRKIVGDFAFPTNPSNMMSGYYVYFGKNSVSAGGSLGNVKLDITC
jgi:hypothetical protein